MDRILFSGNEAIARGAYEAGVKVCSAYPGTPSTEVFEALSQQIQRLEGELGYPLFVRTPRGLTLTAAGETFCREARPP